MMQIQTSEAINEIAAACAKAQAALENVAKTGENPAYKRDGKNTPYATLPGVLAEVRAKFAAQSVAIWQFPVNGESDQIGVVTRFAHSSGQWIEGTLFVRPTKFDAQGAGSVITYLRRYALMAMAGVSGDDDDGNAAVGKPITNGKASSDYGEDYVPLVSTEQRTKLMRLVEEVGTGNAANDQAAFLKWAKVDSFAGIPASLYPKAVAALESRRQAVAAQ